MSSLVERVATALSRSPFLHYVIDELFTADGGLAARLCRHCFVASWPGLGRLAGSLSRPGSAHGRP